MLEELAVALKLADCTSHKGTFELALPFAKVLNAPQRAMAADLAEYKKVQGTLPPAPQRLDFDARPLGQMPEGYVARHFNHSMRSPGLLPTRLES